MLKGTAFAYTAQAISALDADLDRIAARFGRRDNFHKNEAMEFWAISMSTVNRFLKAHPEYLRRTIGGVRITRDGFIAMGGVEL